MLRPPGALRAERHVGPLLLRQRAAASAQLRALHLATWSEGEGTSPKKGNHKCFTGVSYKEENKGLVKIGEETPKWQPWIPVTHSDKRHGHLPQTLTPFMEPWVKGRAVPCQCLDVPGQ